MNKPLVELFKIINFDVSDSYSQSANKKIKKKLRPKMFWLDLKI